MAPQEIEGMDRVSFFRQHWKEAAPVFNGAAKSWSDINRSTAIAIVLFLEVEIWQLKMFFSMAEDTSFRGWMIETGLPCMKFGMSQAKNVVWVRQPSEDLVQQQWWF